MKTLHDDHTQLPRKRRGAASRVAPMQVTATAAQWCVGVVVDTDEAGLWVSSGELRARATQAASCLLAPVPGDSVACLLVAPHEVWIIAVLQREEGTPSVIRCHGSTRLEVEGGGLQVLAENIELDSDKFSVHTQHAQLSTDIAEVVGRQLTVVGSAIKLIGTTLSSVMERVSHFSKHYLRTTEGLDRVHATHLECEADQLLRMNGQNTLITGGQLVKARGAQIHFG